MGKTVTAVFDGSVFRPDGLVDLKPDTRYVMLVQEVLPAAQGDVWAVLEELAGTVEAPPDWSIEHDHYLYGRPKA